MRGNLMSCSVCFGECTVVNSVEAGLATPENLFRFSSWRLTLCMLGEFS